MRHIFSESYHTGKMKIYKKKSAGSKVLEREGNNEYR